MSATCNGNKDIYRPEPATVVRSEPMTELERFLSFKLDSGMELGHMPGQFAEISIAGIGEAPISISSSPTRNGGFEMVVRRIGNVSGAMHRLETGAKVGIRGPFGTGFPVNTDMKGKDVLFICGGIGLVPVRSAIDYVLDNRSDYGRVTVLFGAKSPVERLFLNDLGKWREAPDIDLRETVDTGDGNWKGNVGVITTLMPDLDIDAAGTAVVICGPPVMYKFVIMELKKKQVPAGNIYLSLERHMKCGVGKCGHCQIDNLYVCQDGPVFRYSDIEQVKEAI